MRRTDFPARQKLFNILAFAASLIPVFIYLYLAWQRISYPFDLEWAEGAAVNQVARIMAGEPLYVAPGLNFTPLVYTPLYYFLSALVAPLAGDPLFAMRLVSGLSSVLAGALIFLIVSKRTGQFLAGWVSGALYLACFSLSDGFYDLARADSLFVLLSLIGLLIMQRAKSALAFLGAGLWIALLFFVKQSAVIIFLPVLAYQLVTNSRKSWTMLAGSLAGVSLPLLILNQQTQGWFSYYIFQLPALHGYSLLAAGNFWIGDIIRPLGIAVGLSLAYLVLAVPGQGSGMRFSASGMDGSARPSPPGQMLAADQGVLLAFIVGGLLCAWITRSTNGGGANNCMPAYAAISLLFGLGYAELASRIPEQEGSRFEMQGLLKAVVILQFVGLLTNPFNYLPGGADLAANQTVLDAIQGVEGQVLIPYRSHLPAQFGKAPQIHMVNLFEITGYFKGEVLPEGLDLVSRIREKICRQEYDLVILDQPIPWFDPQLSLAYQPRADGQELEDGRGSPQLSWQAGAWNQYAPRGEYQPGACLELGQ